MIQVIKRDGSKEPLNIDKIHKVVGWACEGLAGVSVSEVELASHVQFYDKITSKDIHETMIKAASELISENATGSSVEGLFNCSLWCELSSVDGGLIFSSSFMLFKMIFFTKHFQQFSINFHVLFKLNSSCAPVGDGKHT